MLIIHALGSSYIIFFNQIFHFGSKTNSIVVAGSQSLLCFCYILPLGLVKCICIVHILRDNSALRDTCSVLKNRACPSKLPS